MTDSERDTGDTNHGGVTCTGDTGETVQLIPDGGTRHRDQRQSQPSTQSLSECQITQLESKHRDAVADIWETRLGTPAARVDEWLDVAADDQYITTGYVAVHGSTHAVIGTSICTVANPDYLNEYINHDDVSVEFWDWTGLLETICVTEDWESCGVASRLVARQLEQLALRGVDGVAAVSWHRDEHIDSRPLFRKFDFEPAAVVPDFYASADEEVYCIDCDGSCECGATVFKRPLSSDYDSQYEFHENLRND